ncbi:MAG: hypothetical protein LBL04_02880 [Bacteroidales bacterium]|jgi:lantibiotic modifying enzyme|nr:hypothetical protein [Bacteroidales bacterium]
MNHTNANIIDLTSKLIPVATGKIPLGLLDGRMGYCIYFFELATILKNSQYKKIAEKLLDTICKEVTHHLPLNIENGLVGIGCGIHHLLQEKHIGGNENDILEKFDIPVFKALSFTEKKPPLDMRIKTQLLYYLSVRYQVQKETSDKEYIFRELVYNILNSFTLLPGELWEEPYSFSIQYRLPFFLYSLGQIAGFEIFRHKVKKIVDEITPKVISFMPVSHAHRLFLVLGMHNVNKIIHQPSWDHHIQLLKREIDINHILTNELRDQNVFLLNGLSGILFLLSTYNHMVGDDEKIFFDTDVVREKIISSTVWSKFLNDDLFFKANSNMNGFCSIALTLLQKN